MKIEELNRILVDFLRDQLPTYSGTFNWSKKIFMDYPRPDATFPRISVTQAAHYATPSAIGEQGPEGKGQYQYTTYEIDIWVQKGNAFQLDSLPAPKHAGTSLRDRLGDDVIQTLMDGKKYLRETYNIYDIEITSAVTIPYMDAYEIFRRSITVRIYYYRTKTDLVIEDAGAALDVILTH
jgi:hypothetical protein